MHEQFYESSGDSGLNNCLNLVVRAVRKVRNSPAGIDQDFVVEGVDELGQNREGRRNLETLESVHVVRSD